MTKKPQVNLYLCRALITFPVGTCMSWIQVWLFVCQTLMNALMVSLIANTELKKWKCFTYSQCSGTVQYRAVHEWIHKFFAAESQCLDPWETHSHEYSWTSTYKYLMIHQPKSCQNWYLDPQRSSAMSGLTHVSPILMTLPMSILTKIHELLGVMNSPSPVYWLKQQKANSEQVKSNLRSIE